MIDKLYFITEKNIPPSHIFLIFKIKTESEIIVITASVVIR